MKLIRIIFTQGKEDYKLVISNGKMECEIPIQKEYVDELLAMKRHAIDSEVDDNGVTIFSMTF